MITCIICKGTTPVMLQVLFHEVSDETHRAYKKAHLCTKCLKSMLT